MSAEEMHLRVYASRSELWVGEELRETYVEGRQSQQAAANSQRIAAAFRRGFLKDLISECLEDPDTVDDLEIAEDHLKLITELTDGVNANSGRALVGLAVLQMAVKAVCPEQCIRLHKGGGRTGTFGWRDGISMRSLDAEYITPTLREYGLLNLNQFGFMMTRTLAENYPYSRHYKAEIKGPRAQWLQLVDLIDSGELDAETALRVLVARLANRADAFKGLADQTLQFVDCAIASDE
ncbi:hypothetical protein FDZ74_07055, partial [bacterium]